MLPFQTVFGLGYTIRALTAEAAMMSNVAAAAALGWVERRHSVYKGNCDEDYYTQIWCNQVPSLKHFVRDVTVGAMPLTGVTSLALALASPEIFANNMQSMLLASQIVVPVLYAPIGAEIGAHMFDYGNQSASVCYTAMGGGYSILGIEIGLVFALGASVLCCGGVVAAVKAIPQCFVQACCGSQTRRAALDLERDAHPSIELATLSIPQNTITSPPAAHPAPVAAVVQMPAHPAPVAAVQASDTDITAAAPAYYPTFSPPAYASK